MTGDSQWRCVVRLQGYELPANVHAAVDAVFGLHGIPLPPKKTTPLGAPGMPPAVTPQVLYDAYNIKGQVKPTGSTTNRVRFFSTPPRILISFATPHSSARCLVVWCDEVVVLTLSVVAADGRR